MDQCFALMRWLCALAFPFTTEPALCMTLWGAWPCVAARGHAWPCVRACVRARACVVSLRVCVVRDREHEANFL